MPSGAGEARVSHGDWCDPTGRWSGLRQHAHRLRRRARLVAAFCTYMGDARNTRLEAVFHRARNHLDKRAEIVSTGAFAGALQSAPEPSATFDLVELPVI